VLNNSHVRRLGVDVASLENSSRGLARDLGSFRRALNINTLHPGRIAFGGTCNLSGSGGACNRALVAVSDLGGSPVA
jgi:hypothetical protein